MMTLDIPPVEDAMAQPTRMSTALATALPDQSPPRDVGAPKVVVRADTSYWGRSALRWATRHARLAGAQLDVRDAADDGGDPVADLVAASGAADLLVIGCRDDRQHGIGLGPLVLPVVELARCDVVVVGGGRAALAGANHRICVLLGTGVAALRGGCRFARQRKTGMTLLSLAYRGDGGRPDDDGTAVADAVAAARSLAPGVAVDGEVVSVPPHEAVANAADADLIVVGGRLDALTRTALYHAPSPVLVAR